MCLISVAWQMHANIPLAIAANRDEFSARASLPLHRWQDSHIMAGKDQVAGGTWMGFHPNGRFAMLTNIRHPDYFKPNIHSRGALITDFLSHLGTTQDWLYVLQQDYERFSGFNLMLGDATQLQHFNSATGRLTALPAGIYGLSNADLDDPWPKVVLAKRQLQNWLARPEFDRLIGLHQDTQIAADALLPDTGIPLKNERALSPQKILLPDYATQVHTAAMVNAQGDLVIREQNAHTSACHDITKRGFWPAVVHGATG